MVWFSFTQAFDFTPSAERRVTVQYKAGCTYNVPRECADKAEAAGAGKRTSKPKAEKPEPEADGADS